MAPNHDAPGTRTARRRSVLLRRRFASRAGAGLVLLPLLSACSPTLDWREQLAPGVGLVTTFPCKPDRHAREVALAGRPIRMEMLVCVAGGATYALSFFDVGEPGATSASLSALRSVSFDNLRSGAARPDAKTPLRLPLAIPGMTPDPQAGQWLFAGRRPDGSELAAREAFFSHGLRVYQAAVVGSRLADEAVEPFFGGLKFPG